MRNVHFIEMSIFGQKIILPSKFFICISIFCSVSLKRLNLIKSDSQYFFKNPTINGTSQEYCLTGHLKMFCILGNGSALALQILKISLVQSPFIIKIGGHGDKAAPEFKPHLPQSSLYIFKNNILCFWVTTIWLLVQMNWSNVLMG